MLHYPLQRLYTLMNLRLKYGKAVDGMNVRLRHCMRHGRPTVEFYVWVMEKNVEIGQSFFLDEDGSLELS
jgi:hypothetical protein